MKTPGNWLNPGHEPILLDLEKLFLLSVSLENEGKLGKIRKLKF